MSEYRKKPVVITAIKWTGANVKEIMDFMNWRNASHDERQGLVIHTLEGNHNALVGDMIIKGVQGEFYPCKADIFATTYEDAATQAPSAATIKESLTVQAPSAPVAPIDERAEFEKAMNAARFFPRELDFSMTKSPSGKRDEYVNTHLESCWNGWQARAALSVKAEPAACTDPVVELNVSMLRSCSAVGVAKYGVTVDDNKLPLRAWLVHALEESLDHANYLQRAMQEIDAAAPTLPTTGEA